MGYIIIPDIYYQFYYSSKTRILLIYNVWREMFKDFVLRNSKLD